MVSTLFTYIDDFRLRPGMDQKGLIGQIVINDAVRLSYGLYGLDGDKARVARTCSHKIDFASGHYTSAIL